MKAVIRHLLLGLACWPCAALSAADAPSKTGPATEQRFPPLRVPAGFKATLFACDPLIEYPSVIAAGPRRGAVFVAIDYMTGLGTEITRRSEVRLVEDTNGDGYAERATTFAGGFNSIMGLAWHRDALYVMHAPFLTRLRDTQGTGVANERQDLLTGLGLTPEENPVRLHCANGVTVGHDGWLYLAMGDHGCTVPRPEGDRLMLEGGGILRCRTDGRQLHVFCNGLRNIYDVALDAELNVFVRDNENDGGTYKIRVCHSFFGADHGYPYLYYEQPSEALRPLADLGLGSSAGGVCYLEPQFPAEYRGSLLFCEWGKSLVRYPLTRAESSFGTPQEIEFAAGSEGDPYGFKPTDVIVQRDGSIMVSDYADGQRPQRGRGRLYHISYPAGARVNPKSTDQPLERLDSESYWERCDAQAAIEAAGDRGLTELTATLAEKRLGPCGRLHAIWILAQTQGPKAIDTLLSMAQSDDEPSVRAQAVRAIADLADPVLSQGRLNAGPGDPELAARLAALSHDQDPRVLLEIIIALGRLRWTGTTNWLWANLSNPDAAVAHAAMQALRQSSNWSSVLPWLDLPSDDVRRSIALRAMSRRYDVGLVDGLLERMSHEDGQARRLEYAAVLARVYKKPGPWVYWNYRPLPRPANPMEWERTEAIAAALNRVLVELPLEGRVVVLTQMQREKIPASMETLSTWLNEERGPSRVATLLEALRELPTAKVREHLEPLILSAMHTNENRRTALAIFVQGIDAEHAALVLQLCERIDDGPILAEGLRSIGKFPTLNAGPLLVGKISSASADVRAAAIEILGLRRDPQAGDAVLTLLNDADPQVRCAAATAAGAVKQRQAIELLLQLAEDPDSSARVASLGALCVLKEPRAVPFALAALRDRTTEQVALQLLRELGGPDNLGPIKEFARRNPSIDVLTNSVQTLTEWRQRRSTTEPQIQELDQAVAEIQGASGVLIRWTVSEVRSANGATVSEPDSGRMQFAGGTDGRLVIASQATAAAQAFQAQTDIALSEPAEVEFLGSSNATWRISLNGTTLYQREKPQPFRIDSERFSTTLPRGNSRLIVQVEATPSKTPVEFHLRIRRKSLHQEHERLLQAVLSRTGSRERGRAVFLNAEKSLCLKCHRVDQQGERIGPELTGVGSRFSRIYIAESILQPSRTIAPSFGTVVCILQSGKIVSGVKIAENQTQLTLVDNQGKKHSISKDEIEEQADSHLSTMPEGLEKRLVNDDFVDLVTYLSGLKQEAKP